mmetsp:Transcript_11652/g.17701  ORF Transcript_11652/g.17701 Transcript_11652/m.17701 type:complete len:111 (-) Transcript_11652:2182-2514(-)
MTSKISSDNLLRKYHERKAKDPRNFCLFLNFLLLFRELPRQLQSFEPVAFSELFMILLSTVLLIPSLKSEKYYRLIRYGFMLTQLRLVTYHLDFDNSRKYMPTEVNSIVN